MARKPRIVAEGGAYHVYNRIASGEAIFADPDEAVELVEIIKKVPKGKMECGCVSSAL